jgi:hypothetical protein
MKKLLLGGALLLLSGCASVAGNSAPFDLSEVTVTDLKAALARATAADDKPAMQCYAGLIPIVQALPKQVPNIEAAGVVDAFEIARLAAKKAQTFTGANDPIVQGVNMACAALFNDAKGDLLRLGIRFRP